jgi:hypothetical protein
MRTKHTGRRRVARLTIALATIGTAPPSVEEPLITWPDEESQDWPVGC